jgi:UDP-N-acetyl-D-mannosaminuronic acid transferase (WecB/TagA/CpsF family)
VASQKVFEQRLQQTFPDLDFDFYIYREEDKQNIFKEIQSSGAQIAFSTLGMKRQEACIHETLDHCSNIKL